MNEMLLLTGLAIFLGLFGGKLFNSLKFPAVVGYILFGVIMGPSVVNLFYSEAIEHFNIISDFVLGLIAFSIGGELKITIIKRIGWGIVTILIFETFGTFFIVGGSIYFYSKKIALSLILGALAAASAPAGIWVVLREYRAKGPLTETVLAVVGLDDALAIVIYSFAIAIAKLLIIKTGKCTLAVALLTPLKEISGSILLGIVLGFIFILIVREIKSKQDYLTFVLSFIMICTGLATKFHLSIILANMVMGIVLGNGLIRVHKKISEVLESITQPIYILFFFLAGAHLQLSLLSKMGTIGIIYLITRIIGKMAGSYIGASIVQIKETVKKYLGLAILSQAGVAVGMAILVGKELSPLGIEGKEIGILAINTIAATTIIFEIIGPVAAKIALTGAGEIGKAR